MNALVIEHVKISELPEAWRAKLPMGDSVCVTVRIEEEIANEAEDDSPLFGMWRDREDMADVGAYLGKLREPRF